MKSTTMSSAVASSEAVVDVISDSSRPWGLATCSHFRNRRAVKMTLLLVAVLVTSVVLLYITDDFTFMKEMKLDPKLGSILTNQSTFVDVSAILAKNHLDPKLESVLRNASMPDRTVILTTLNDAWAKPGSVIDLFLKSFHIGEETAKLLKHVVIITLDLKAYDRCIALHPHCYHLHTKSQNFTHEALFMTSEYLHMVWRRIELLGIILEMGYSFVFTDLDVMWFRDPFKRFFKDADFQIACDVFRGNSYNKRSKANGGFAYVRSNPRSISFYKFWYASRISYPELHDQDVFNKIKNHPFLTHIKLEMRFLDTTYFAGFCEPSKDVQKVCTTHANCCVGLDDKLHDLKILLQDWKRYRSLPPNQKLSQSHFHWSVPQLCRSPQIA